MDALLLIDLQEDFLAPPPLAERRGPLLDATLRWVDAAAERDAPVFVVTTVVPADPSTWALNMRADESPVALEGTAGARLAAELSGIEAQHLTKRRDDAFLGTDLDDRLRSIGATRLVVAGVSTQACIAVTAASAYARDYRVNLAAGAVASTDPQAHAEALRWLEREYRQQVVTPADVT